MKREVLRGSFFGVGAQKSNKDDKNFNAKMSGEILMTGKKLFYKFSSNRRLNYGSEMSNWFLNDEIVLWNFNNRKFKLLKNFICYFHLTYLFIMFGIKRTKIFFLSKAPLFIVWMKSFFSIFINLTLSHCVCGYRI